MTPGSSDPTDEDTRTIERTAAAVFHYLRLLGCEPSTAADLTQETFLVYLRKRPTGPDAQLRSFLRSTARFLYIDHLRRARRWDDRSSAWADQVDAAWQSGALREWDDERHEALERCRRRLPDRAQEAVRLHYDLQLSRHDVADRLGLKANGVKTLLQRARQLLRQCMHEVLDESSR